jgi:hypothetical protein
MISASPEPRPRPPANGGAAPISPQAQPCLPACPRCKNSVIRIPRRFIDRVISVVHPIHRYRCRSFICNWEGNVPYKAPVPDGWDAMATNAQSPAPASSIAPDRTSYITDIDKNTM